MLSNVDSFIVFSSCSLPKIDPDGIAEAPKELCVLQAKQHLACLQLRLGKFYNVHLTFGKNLYCFHCFYYLLLTIYSDIFLI